MPEKFFPNDVALYPLGSRRKIRNNRPHATFEILALGSLVVNPCMDAADLALNGGQPVVDLINARTNPRLDFCQIILGRHALLDENERFKNVLHVVVHGGIVTRQRRLQDPRPAFMEKITRRGTLAA